MLPWRPDLENKIILFYSILLHYFGYAPVYHLDILGTLSGPCVLVIRAYTMISQCIIIIARNTYSIEDFINALAWPHISLRLVRGVWAHKASLNIKPWEWVDMYMWIRSIDFVLSPRLSDCTLEGLFWCCDIIFLSLYSC